MVCLRKFMFVVLLLNAFLGAAFGQLATYVGTGGTSITVTGYPNETVSNLQYTGFGTNTACGSGGRSGLTVNTSWNAYSSAAGSPRVFIKIVPNTGYMLNVTGFSANLRSSPTGPTCARFAYSLDNGVTWIDDGACHVPNITGTCGSATLSSWSGGALPASITSTTNGIIVAIFPYLPGGSTGTFQINRIDISGTVVTACIPPVAITGPTSVCSGQTISLTNTVTGGSWSTNNSASATVTATGVVTGGIAGTSVITYSTGCGTDATTTITTNPLPNAGSISGVPVVCPGATTQLSNAAGGGVWSSVTTSVATISGPGLVSGVSTGTSVISYTVTNVCGTAVAQTTVTVNPLPVSGAITGLSSVCVGSAIILSDPVSGGVWSTGQTTIATVNNSGFVTGLSGGASTISYAVTNSCGTAVATTSVAVYDLPLLYTVTGGGHYCPGGVGVHVGLGGSQLGISYQLFRGSTPMGAPFAGTGSSIDFGFQTAGGTYYVVGTSGVTGCATNMSGTVLVIIDPLPNSYAVTGGGAICSGVGGVLIGLSSSDVGINYQLYIGSTPVSSLPGTGSALDFGVHTTAGTYVITGTNPVTFCTNSMAGSAVIIVTTSVTPSVSINAGPGGTICSGLNHSFTATSINGGTAPLYQWYVNGVSVAIGSSYNYVPANGDVLKVKLTSNAVCPLPDTAVSSMALTVQPTAAPYVNINVDPGNLVCEGEHVTYTAVPAFGGTAPSYKWVKNGIQVASGASYYSYTPVDGDDIYCVMKSNYVCPVIDSAVSGLVHMTVLPFTLPLVTITASPTTLVSVGQTVTLKAVVSNTGLYSALAYQWLINGIAIPGANTNQYISNNFRYPVPDSVTCLVTCSGGGCDPVGVFSWVYINVFPVSVAQVPVAFNGVLVLPNPNKGKFKITGSLAGTETDKDDLHVDVTNVMGQVVYRSAVRCNNGEIDAYVELDNSIANGMYILNLFSGTARYTSRIMVER